MADKNNKKSVFNEASLKRLNEAIKRLPGLAESLKNQGVSLQELDEVHVFGYGSLPDQPHYQPDSIETAFLWGYSRDMCVKSVRSGTEILPGLTLGLDKKDEGIVAGAILTYKNMDLDKLSEMLEAFAEREVVKELPIYKFEFVEIEKEDGSTAHAIACVADESGPGYFGKPTTPLEKTHMTAEEQEEEIKHKKAMRIAEANGFLPVSKKHATCKSYFDRFVRYPIEQNPAISDPEELVKMAPHERRRNEALHKEQERLKDLAKWVDYHRAQMKLTRKTLVKILEEAEDAQMKGWLAKKKAADAVRRPAKTPKGAFQNRK